MLIKKIVILFIVSFNCWAGTPWNIGQAVGGRSIYTIENKDKIQLYIGCTKSDSILSLWDKKGDNIDLGESVLVIVDGTKMEIPTLANTMTPLKRQFAWENFISYLTESKTIVIDGKKFEPNNSKKISDITTTCAAYNETDNTPPVPQNTTQQTTKPLLKVSVQYEQTRMSNIPITVPIVHLVGLSEKPFNVQGLIVNKGNCKVTAYGLDMLKKPMVYGEERTVALVASSTCSTLLDVVVQTDLGNFAYTFK